MQVSVFNPTKTRDGKMIPGTKPVGEMTYQKYFDAIHDGLWEEIVLNIRAGRQEKISAPGITPSGTFSYRATGNLLQHSGVLGLDFDAKDNDYFPADEIAVNPYVFGMHRSISGKGWVVYVKIDPARHLDAFLALEKYFANEYQVILDQSCKDVSRFRFISYDPDLIHNPAAKSWKKYLPKKTIMPRNTNYVHTDNDVEHCINQITARGINIGEEYHEWIQIGMAFASEFGEQGRDYFHQVSAVSLKYDREKCDKKYTNLLKTGGGRVKIASFFWLCKLSGIEIKTKRTTHIERVSKMQRRVVGASGGHTSKEAATAAAVTILKDIDGIEGEDVEQVVAQVMALPEDAMALDAGDDLVANVKEFLRSYHLKFNQVTRHIETEGRNLEDRDYNSIYIKALEVLTPPNGKGRTVTQELIKAIIESDNTDEYHPFKDWFRAHSNLKPTGVVEALLDCIKVQDFKHLSHHVEGGEYLQKYGRKWLISCVASWHGTYSVMMLVLTGGQMIGKTKFFRGLLPEDLRGYYAESSLDEGKDSEIMMCKKAIICDDEFEGMNKGDYKRLKALISKQTFTVRKPYGRVAEDLPRYAVLCGTGNEEEIINDPTGNRRIIPVPVIDIDWKKYALIDKDALWMELYNEWKTIGDDWMMTRTDVKILNQLTVANEQTSIEEELIMQFFSLPSEGGYSDFMSNTEIRNYIEMNTAKMRISSKMLGLYLGKLGFEKKLKKINGMAQRVYEVVKVRQVS